MEFLLKKKLNSSMHKTLNKIYNNEYIYTGKLDTNIFNEYLIILVKSGLKKDDIKKLLIQSLEGDENEFSALINKNNELNNINSFQDIICLILFGMIVTIMFFNLFI